MDEYASLRKIEFELCEGNLPEKYKAFVRRVLNDRHLIPVADVAPVVHGRWENGNPICPVCGEDKFKDLDADIWCDWLPPFCPNCGAKMSGGADHGA